VLDTWAGIRGLSTPSSGTHGCASVGVGQRVPEQGRADRRAPERTPRMSIGAGIALFAIGAILAFAVNVEVEWVNLDMIGYILMGAGAVIFIVGIVLLARRRRSESVTHTAVDPTVNERVTRQSTSSTDDAAGL